MSSALIDEEKDALGPLVHPVPNNLKPVKNLDEFIHMGRYVVLILIVAEFLCLSTLANMVYMVFSGANPVVVGCGNHTFESRIDTCGQFYRMQNETGCEPRIESQFTSVNVEFNYLCDDSKVVKNSISIQMTAVLLGAFIFGQMSDLYGRRRVLLAAILLSAAFTAASAHAPTFTLFTVVRVIACFFTGGISSVQGVFMVENVPRKHRMLINTVITWSPNFILYPILAWLSGDWRTLAIVCAVINILGFVFIYFCYESPRFLIQKGRIDEARRVLTNIRRINHEKCEETSAEIESMLRHEQEVFDNQMKKAKKYTFWHIMHTKKYALNTVTLCFGIMVTSLVNYGILFNMEKLTGSLYLNNIVFGIIRWAMNITVGVLDYKVERLGRKHINIFSESFNLVCLGIVFVVFYGGTQLTNANLIRVCSIAVTSMCAQVYIAKFMTTTEWYPTAVRNLASAALSMSSRIGTIFGPMLFYLSDLHPSYPYLALAILVTIDMIGFQFIIEETKGKLLENHLPTKKRERRHSIIDRRPSIAECE